MHPHRHLPVPADGFTFIEIVVAMAILALAMAGTFRMMSVSMQTRQVAQNHYVATVMANNRIERAKNLAFGELSLLAETEVAVDSLGTPDPDGRYLRSTLIQPNFDSQTNLTRITVTIVPPAPNRRTDEGLAPVSVSTLLTVYQSDP
jgi:type II secretion system protein I